MASGAPAPAPHRPPIRTSSSSSTTSASLPLRLPRPLTAAELHLELEQEQEAVVRPFSSSRPFSSLRRTRTHLTVTCQGQPPHPRALPPARPSRRGPIVHLPRLHTKHQQQQRRRRLHHPHALDLHQHARRRPRPRRLPQLLHRPLPHGRHAPHPTRTTPPLQLLPLAGLRRPHSLHLRPAVCRRHCPAPPHAQQRQLHHFDAPRPRPRPRPRSCPQRRGPHAQRREHDGRCSVCSSSGGRARGPAPRDGRRARGKGRAGRAGARPRGRAGRRARARGAGRARACVNSAFGCLRWRFARVKRRLRLGGRWRLAQEGGSGAG